MKAFALLACFLPGGFFAWALKVCLFPTADECEWMAKAFEAQVWRCPQGGPSANALLARAQWWRDRARRL